MENINCGDNNENASKSNEKGNDACGRDEPLFG